MKDETIGLIYIGENGAYIPDLGGELVPARNLSADEVKYFGEATLLASGLYAKPRAKSASDKQNLNEKGIGG